MRTLCNLMEFMDTSSVPRAGVNQLGQSTAIHKTTTASAPISKDLRYDTLFLRQRSRIPSGQLRAIASRFLASSGLNNERSTAVG
mmetsp:Transcript_17545/g.37946  ORF Transcript_17545/g.37946 Transcript_17545/m.37946 type:complete len:85 (+) Transcript_17545:3635-3889(+)